MDFLIRIAEGQDPEPLLLWDTVWNITEGQADWAVSDGTDGGLRATSALHTAVLLCLFTDKRVPDEHPLRKFIDGDPGGYWGDAIDVRLDLGETGDMGSYLHALERSPLSDEIARMAQAICEEALATLITQRVCVRVEVEVAHNDAVGRLEILVRLYGRDGQAIYDQRFGALWAQTQGAA